MWKFLEGVSQPQKKAKVTNEEKLEKDRVYDKEKRVRNFQPGWKKDRDGWLDNTDKGMVCRSCIAHSKDRMNSFVVGTKNFKLSAIAKHENSNNHQTSHGIYSV